MSADERTLGERVADYVEWVAIGSVLSMDVRVAAALLREQQAEIERLTEVNKQITGMASSITRSRSGRQPPRSSTPSAATWMLRGWMRSGIGGYGMKATSALRARRT